MSFHDVPLKLINKTEYGLNIDIGDDSGSFGFGRYPVIYADIPYDQITTIKLQQKPDEQLRKQAKWPKVINNGTGVVAIGGGYYHIAGKACKKITEAAMTDLAQNVLEHSEKAMRADPQNFGAYLVYDAIYGSTQQAPKLAEATKKAVDVAEQGKKMFGLGVAHIGVDIVDYGLRKYDGALLEQTLTILPSKIPDFYLGKMVVIEVYDRELKIYSRNIPIKRKAITCLVETQSNYPLVCTYKDEDGDLAFVRLHPSLAPARLTLREINPFIDVKEVIPHDESLTHHCLTTVKGGLSATIAVLDPFPLTKAYSAYCAVSNLYTGVTKAATRYMTNRCLRLQSKDAHKLQIYDKDDYCIGVRVVRLSSLKAISNLGEDY